MCAYKKEVATKNDCPIMKFMSVARRLGVNDSIVWRIVSEDGCLRIMYNVFSILYYNVYSIPDYGQLHFDMLQKVKG